MPTHRRAMQDGSRTRGHSGGYGNGPDADGDAVLGSYGVADEVEFAAETVAVEMDAAVGI